MQQSLGGASISFGANISGFKAGIAEMVADITAFSRQASSMANSASASMGNTFAKVASSASSASASMGNVFTKLGDALNATQTRMPAFHTAWQNITSALGSAGNAVSSVWGKITGFTGGLINHVSQLGQTVFWTKQLAEAGVGLVTSLFSQNAAMEQTRIGFVGLLGSGQKADAMLKDLQAFAAATPFEFPELAKDAQMLIGMGFAAKSVIPMMTSVGDAVAGVGAGAAGVETVTRVLGQMQAAGKVNAGDMMQITSLGIPAWKILADSMGKTTAEVMKMSSQGLIPAQTGINALVSGMEKMYGGQMANQAKSFNGIISTLHDNLGMAFQTFLTPAFNLAKSGLTVLADIVSSPKFGEFARVMGENLSGALQRVVGFVQPLIPRITDLVKNFFSAGGAAQQLGTFLTENVVTPARHLYTVISPLITSFADWVVSSGALRNAITLVGSAIGGSIIVIGKFVDGIASMIDWFQKGSIPAQILGAALTGIGVAIAAINIAAFIATIPALIAGFIGWATAAGAAALATLAATWPILAIGAAIALVVAGIILAIKNWGAISKWLQGAWEGTQGFFSNLWTNVKNTFFTAVDAIKSTVSTKTGQAADFLRNAWVSSSKATATAWGDMFSTVGSFLTQMWQKIVAIGTNIKNSFLGVWTSIAGAIGGVIRGMANNAIGVLNGMLSSLQGFVNGLAAGINNIATAVGAKAFVTAPAIGRVPYLASGTKNFLGGPAIVGEEGPELVVLPKGASVLPTPQTKSLLQTGILGGIPGFAGGTGNAFSDVLGWIGGGLTAVGNLASSAFTVTKSIASTVLSHVFGNILSMSGPFSGIASAIGSMIRNWGVEMVMGLLNQIKAVVAPTEYGGAGGASFAGTGSVADWVAQALAITGAPQSWLGPLTLIAMHESGGNPSAINLWDCVTIDTMILTKRGWLDYTQVMPGDETIGVNPVTGLGEWTKITHVVSYNDADVYEIGNARWKAQTTPNHRWYGYVATLQPQTTLEACPYCDFTASTQGIRVHLGKIHTIREHPKDREPYKRYGMFATNDIKNKHTIVTAVPAQTPDNPAITVQEATLLGWLFGDGHIEKKRKEPAILIYQAKPQFIEKIRAVLSTIQHTEYTYTPQPGRQQGYQWRLNYTYAQDLLARSGYDETNPIPFILSLSPAQRRAWLDAVIDAEGTHDADPAVGERGGNGTMIYQRVGPKLDAIQLAAYLEGYRPGIHRVQRRETERSANWQPEASISLCKPVISGAFLQRKRLDNQTVWCVTTELGTWTARYEDSVFLTGNSNYLAGIPSKGLMQTIDPTFNAYMLAGHGNIWNPVDNAIAAIRYITARYGGVYNVPGVVNMMRGGPYVGYAGGGVISEQIIGTGLSSGRNYHFGERGPETVIPGTISGTQTINLVVDGRTMAHALASHMIQEIRLVLGRNL